jgi:hypothetical protein
MIVTGPSGAGLDGKGRENMSLVTWLEMQSVCMHIGWVFLEAMIVMEVTWKVLAVEK